MRRLFALIMVFVFVLSLAACSNGKDKDQATVVKTDEKETSTETTAPTTEIETEVVDPYPAFDMGGRTINIGQWFDRYYDSNHTSISDNPNLTNEVTAKMQLENVRRIEKKYNVKIVSHNLAWAGVVESLNTSVAAGTPEMDVYTVDLQFGTPAIANGLAMPVSEYAPEYSDVTTNQTFMKTLEVLGDAYVFAPKTLASGGLFMGYNAEMIESLGLEDPQSLYKKGEWTWEKFAEYALAATKDLDGDGIPDQFGYAGISGTNYGFVYANNGVLAKPEKEALSSKEVMEAYSFLDRLYNVDKSAKWFTETDDPNSENLYAWAKGNILFWGTRAWQLLAGVNNFGADFEYHIVPFPVGPSGDGSKTTPVGGQWYMIPKGVENPEQVYQIMEEYFNWFNFDTSYIYDTESFEQYFLNEKDMEIALEAGGVDKEVLDVAFHVGFNLAEFDLAIVTGEKTVAQAVEEYKLILQDKLNSVFNK